MKLVACPNCRAQYDVANLPAASVSCRCGATVATEPPSARDAAVTRCAACGALVGEAERTCAYCGAEVTRQAEPAGPVCPECYARNPVRARHCTSCGIGFLPQPVRTHEEPLECPACPGVELTARSLGGVWVDECPMCLGLWAPGDVMDRLVERARERHEQEGPPAAEPAHRERRSTWQEQVSYRRCPECGGTMQRRNFGHRSGVIVDWCGSHGTWLDPHEMEDIAAFVLEGGLETALAKGGDRNWRLPADPGRTAAILAAEKLLAEERARSLARRHGGDSAAGRALRGLGDFLATLLK